MIRTFLLELFRCNNFLIYRMQQLQNSLEWDSFEKREKAKEYKSKIYEWSQSWGSALKTQQMNIFQNRFDTIFFFWTDSTFDDPEDRFQRTYTHKTY